MIRIFQTLPSCGWYMVYAHFNDSLILGRSSTFQPFNYQLPYLLVTVLLHIHNSIDFLCPIGIKRLNVNVSIHLHCIINSLEQNGSSSTRLVKYLAKFCCYHAPGVNKINEGTCIITILIYIIYYSWAIAALGVW